MDLGVRNIKKNLAKMLVLAILAIGFFSFSGNAQAATNVYYSVGQSVANLMTASPTVTIASGVATFSIAQSGNIGVGDRVTYNTNSVAYISGKTSTSVWSFVTATGGIPADITNSTVISITREFTLLSTAVTAASNASHINNADLVSANVILNLPCYYDSGADTAGPTIDGYTTGPSNYIKIYTPSNTSNESNNSQRHQGKWDDSKFKLVTGLYGVAVKDNFVTIDGLQVRISGRVGNITDISVTALDASNEINISNNILTFNDTGDPVNNPLPFGISLFDPDLKARVWNNILYGFKDETGGYGVALTLPLFSSVIIYNNVFVDSFIGVSKTVNYNSAMKNNIAQGNNTDYNVATASGTYAYNLSSDATAPGTNAKINTNVLFADALNKDFHLGVSDTSAKNSGSDLSADPSFAFNIDIDGHTRQTGAWDLGADEGAMAVYYSVGQNTTSHETGSSTITVDATSRTATFSVPQTASNMGVGDLITYVGGSCFVTSKTSTLVWGCQSALGGAPTAAPAGTDVTSVAHAFASLSSAVTGASGGSYLNTSDLAGGNFQLNFPCYYDTSADMTAVTLQNYTTSVSNFIKIYTPINTLSEVNQNQRHQGKWNDSRFRVDANGAFQINVSNTVVDGIQFDIGGNGLYIQAIADAVAVSNSIVKSSYGANYGIRVDGSSATPKTAFIYNNIVYGGENEICRFADGTGKSVHVYNNTVYGGASSGIYDNQGSSIVAKNNIVQGSVDGFKGTFLGSSNYNISDQASDAPGTNPKNSTTVSFVDTAGKNFHLFAEDTSAHDAGVNLSSDQYFAFDADIDGQGRIGTWDIGADEFSETQIEKTNPVENVESGLVGHWTFDGADISGGTAKDSSANNNDGTISDATAVIGKLGQAMSFNGTSSHISIANAISGIKTVSFWVKPGNVVSKKIMNVDGTKQLEINGSSNVVATNFPSATIYIDGVASSAIDSNWHFVTIVDTSGVNFSTMDIGHVSGGYFPGTIDDVRIYNRALSQNEINILYNNGQAEVRKTGGITRIRK